MRNKAHVPPRLTRARAAFAVTSTGLNAGFTLASQTSLPLFPLILGILALGSLATLTLSDIDARRPWFKHGTAGLVGLRLVMGIVSLSLESLARWVEHGFGACLYGCASCGLAVRSSRLLGAQSSLSSSCTLLSRPFAPGRCSCVPFYQGSSRRHLRHPTGHLNPGLLHRHRHRLHHH